LPVGIYPVSPATEFEPGMVAEFTTIGNEIVLTKSDGTAPIGIIDDVRATAFQRAVTNDEVIIPAQGSGYGATTPVDVTGNLSHASVVRGSFVSSIPVTLNEVNGTITAPAGTALNYDSDSDGIYDSIRVVCSYTYQIPDVLGDDTTAASGKLTIWISRGIYATDQYDTTQSYVLNAPLYCGTDGKFTSVVNGPAIALTITPPTSIISELELLWL
jgi:hypothetical protein